MSEIQKMAAVQDQSQAIGEFIEWLNDHGMHIARYQEISGYRDQQLVPEPKSITQLLADYFEIDLNKVEDEKRALLKQIREAQS